MRKTIFAFAFLLAVSAPAQPAMAFGMNPIIRDASNLTLVNRAEVAKDLNESTEQKSLFAELQRKMHAELQALQGTPGASANPGKTGKTEEAPLSLPPGKVDRGGEGGAQLSQGPADPRKIPEERIKIAKKYAAEVNKILDAGQQARMKEIRIQLMGDYAITDPDMQKELAVTSSQKAQIEKLKSDVDKARIAMIEKVRSGKILPDDFAKELTATESIFEKGLKPIYTADQLKQLAAMKGKPFTLVEKGSKTG